MKPFLKILLVSLAVFTVEDSLLIYSPWLYTLDFFMCSE